MINALYLHVTKIREHSLMIFFLQLLAIHKLIKHVNQENTFYKSPLNY